MTNATTSETRVIKASILMDKVRRILKSIDTPEQVADEVAFHLVNAELSGHASHGVLRVMQYEQEAARGIIKPSKRPEVVSEKGAMLVIDGAFGFGHAAAALATSKVGDAACRHGIALATIKNATHIGRVGEYAERLGERGLVSIIVLGAAGPGVGSMAAFGSQSGTPFMNTNPWSLGFPMQSGNIVFDAAMTTIAEGKVHASKRAGKMLPEGSVLDKNGKPSNDPEAYYEGGTLSPLGGTAAGHKGYGLALSAALLGALAHADGTDTQLRGLAALRNGEVSSDYAGGVTLIAIDPSFVGKTDAYKEKTQRIHNALKMDGVIVPGQMEADNRRIAEGNVTLPKVTLESLDNLEKALKA